MRCRDGVLVLLVAAPLRALAAGVDAQSLQTLDGGPFVALREADAGAPWSPAAAVSIDAAWGLVYLETDDGGEVPLLGRVVTQEQGVSLRIARTVRVGVDVPVHRAILYDGFPIRDVWGDTSIWMLVPILDRGVRVASWTQVDLPTGSPGVYLGDQLPTMGAGVAAEGVHAGWTGLLNVGVRVGSAGSLLTGEYLDHWELGAGFRRDLWGRAFVTGEVYGSVPVALPVGDAVAVPFEAVASVGMFTGRGFEVHAGAGRGLTGGLGTSEGRLFAVVAWRAGVGPDTDIDGVADDDDACRLDAEDRDRVDDADGCPEDDADEDGFADVADTCPTRPERRNGLRDADGCPDAWAEVTVRVESVDPATPPAGATVRVDGGEAVPLGEGRELKLEPGPHELRVEAEGFRPESVRVELGEGQRERIVGRLARIPSGTVTVSVLDPDGKPLAALLRRGETVAPLSSPIRAEAGPATWWAYAQGHAPAPVTLEVADGGAHAVEVGLAPARVRVVDGRVPLAAPIAFAPGSRTLPAEADPVVEDLVALLLTEPRITRLRVEAFADEGSTGEPALALSLDRAVAVRNRLALSGVSMDRLEVLGSGARLAGDGPGHVALRVLGWSEPAREE